MEIVVVWALPFAEHFGDCAYVFHVNFVVVIDVHYAVPSCLSRNTVEAFSCNAYIFHVNFAVGFGYRRQHFMHIEK